MTHVITARLKKAATLAVGIEGEMDLDRGDSFVARHKRRESCTKLSAVLRQGAKPHIGGQKVCLLAELLTFC
jgi:hypothetical protein